MLDYILSEFGINDLPVTVSPVYQGLINNTWKVAVNGHAYIVQKLNQHVFKNPEEISYNISQVAEYLAKHHPEYFFVAPLKTGAGESIIKKDGVGYFRVFPYVKDSHTINVVTTPDEAFEAAKQFGKFSSMLSQFDAGRLKITIPGFHDLSLRYRQFRDAREHGNKDRISGSAGLIKELEKHAAIVEEYEKIKSNPAFKLRTMHHDTKISNVLFDKNNKGICVIDLDTLMPGYFISDVGDMMRTYLSPVSEEEKDFSKIVVRKEVYEAIVQGYLDEMDTVLTEQEKKYFFYAGCFIIYMQSLRFLTDHLNGDVYYGAGYPGHNMVRAENQLTLLTRLLEMREELI